MIARKKKMKKKIEMIFSRGLQEQVGFLGVDFLTLTKNMQTGGRLIGHSKLPVGVSEHGWLFLSI